MKCTPVCFTLLIISNNGRSSGASKVIRAVLAEITDYLDCAMVRQDSCMAEFNAKEAKRKESLKGAIKLD